MTRIPRQVRRIEDASIGPRDSLPEAIRSYSDLPAWVLLGEPGAGKSEALNMEAEASGGICLRIAEFIDSDPDPDWRDKTLFLDGLDEIRAGSDGGNLLTRVRRQLKQLGNPPFRIACRAADWYGNSDVEDLKSASADGQNVVLQLEPLNEQDILALLHDNHGVAEPEAFVEKAHRLGVDGLLDNPQMLGLLAQAVQGDRWPGSRDETYRLACEKLADEHNKRHRDKARNRPDTVEARLDAAGQLCAVLLLSDQTGIALDAASADSRFIPLAACSPPDLQAAALAINSKLFRPEGSERVVPSHRSVAEYLAARWLARQIDANGLPLGRVLNLLLGRDGRTVTGLRGLYAWLALHSQKARTRLIEADPLTVVLYGDVKPMTVSDKRAVLAGLRREAERYHGFRWGVRNTHAFGALADPALREDFLAVLKALGESDADQAFLSCVLAVLAEGRADQELGAALLGIIRDDHFRDWVRQEALAAWLASVATPDTALALLDDIRSGLVTDSNDELSGSLLQHLYPRHISPEKLLDFLHIPKDSSLFGTYYWFWSHEFPRQAPDSHLPMLLDGLVGRTEIQLHATYDRPLNAMADKLLVRGILNLGDSIDDERLYAWLGMGADEYGGISRDQKADIDISEWLSKRPSRIKTLLSLIIGKCNNHSDHALAICVPMQAKRLHQASTPDDIGLWHLEQADKTDSNEISRFHLDEAINCLMNQRGDAGLSLEKLEDWASKQTERKTWLESRLVWQIPERHLERIAQQTSRQQARAEVRRNRTIDLQRHWGEIQSGKARSQLMHQLAGIWMDLYTDTHGASPAERFASYCENGHELLAMAEAGFRLCPERDDLPTVAEIIELSIKQQEHFIRRPCLVGMELRWRDGVETIDVLPEATLHRMLAFRLTDGIGNTPAWFIHLVRQHPDLVAGILFDYASATLKAGKDHVNYLYPLERDPDYQAVATLAAPRLLEIFPVKARSGQLRYLENLLKAALHYSPETLPALIEKKLSMRSMDEAQKVYWYATAMLLDPERYESALWRHVGKSEVRTNHLSSFLSDALGRFTVVRELSAGTLGKLIERIAPHAEIDHPSGGGAFTVTDAMNRGDQIRALINRLSALTTPEAEKEINRLLALPALLKLKPLLEATRHELLQRQRESEFSFLQPREVAQVLANQAPASIADLAALALDVLDDIGGDIRQENDDGGRAFWNIWKEKHEQKILPREENFCRDALVPRLRARLDPKGIECQIEKDHANDKRADLSLSYLAKFELPIEIKKDSNPSLWSALREQLIGQYAIAPRAFGYGIYLVLWFGGKGMPGVKDGGKKPRSPEELRTRLESQLDPLERQRIFVRVLDVSWPEWRHRAENKSVQAHIPLTTPT